MIQRQQRHGGTEAMQGNPWRRALGLATIATLLVPATVTLAQPLAQGSGLSQNSPQDLFLAYPPEDHHTTAPQIFLIGTAAPQGEVLVNGQPVDRSPAGHFAPSIPLAVGANTVTLRFGTQELTRTITRLDPQPSLPQGLALGENSLSPAVAVARQAGEWVCFGAIAPPGSTLSVAVGREIWPLTELALTEQQAATLPDNGAVLLKNNAPQALTTPGQYQGCGRLNQGGTLQPRFHLSYQGQSLSQDSPGTLEMIDPQVIRLAEVTAPFGTARIGPSTDYSRLTPLPTGTQAQITGREGDWLRLDYGAWIKASEVRELGAIAPPQAIIRSALTRSIPGWTEVVFPLTQTVPVTVDQDQDSLTLTLHNTTAQTDTVYIGADGVIDRFQWSQPRPEAVAYTFFFKTPQQWGYRLRYDGTSLILSLKHPPHTDGQSLQGVHVFLDPGHGSANDLGARGPNGYPEKDVALAVSQQVALALEARGAQVSLSRQGDDDLWPQDRVALMDTAAPDLALSLHYNALPDGGDAANTQGIGAFWYHPQSQDLAQFFHDYLTRHLDRPSYGVFWNNLALTRPAFTPAVLLELGFMINPQEFEWITDAQAQGELAQAIAAGVEEWVHRQTLPRAVPSAVPHNE